MKKLNSMLTADRTLMRRYEATSLLAVVILGAILYLAGVPANPPGFYLDESSIAYNAHLIAQRGSDEFGERWPLYFRSFGDYKSPVYVYLLAALFKVSGPSITVARGLSGVLGLLSALALGLLAARIAHRRSVGFIVALCAILTPWLFETSRLVFEVAFLPLALTLFLLLLHFASKEKKWSWLVVVGLAAGLGLITYSYAVGRLLAPLLALGLALFASRDRWRSIICVWLVYALTLLPLFVFNLRHPGALMARFYWSSYIQPDTRWTEIPLEFIKRYAANLDPRYLLLTGNPEHRLHVPGMGSILVGTVLLAIAGLILVSLYQRRDSWWQFILYSLVVCVIPASLTNQPFHTLRLAAFPIFLLILTVPALVWLLNGSQITSSRRIALMVLMSLTLIQGFVFQWQFHNAGAKRGLAFDASYPEVFAAATAVGKRPIYVIYQPEWPAYVHAYWYATLRGLDTSQFILLPNGTDPPKGALVIGTGVPRSESELILYREPFSAYIAY